jgi:hypothetical protein
MSETNLRDLGPQMEALKAVLSDLLSSPILEKFARVWQEMGVEDENLATRRDTIRLHIHNLMEDMYREEEVLKAKLIESVAHCTKELAELCNQLSLPFEGPPDDLPLAAREKQLRQKADTLTKEKHSRLKRLKRLSELEVAMCRCLNETPKLTSILSSGQLPSEDELQHYRGLVGRLEKKKNDRQTEFLALREKVLGLWKELEMEPHEQFEQQVATGDIRVFVLSSENLTRLNKFYAEVCTVDLPPSHPLLPSPSHTVGGRGHPSGGQGPPATWDHTISLGETGGTSRPARCLLPALHRTQTQNHCQFV